ncbi:MAG TPA: magnesium-translocating P-type ATPase [Gemmatimonadaceae bacterium]|nr:magnesium-translocating P-type ATPase [Gemmatimonadaceae bacterium]
MNATVDTSSVGAPALTPRRAEPTSAPGLTGDEARRRLAVDGANEPSPAARRSFARELIRPLASPLVGILVAASFVAAIAGQVADAVIIVVMVLLSAALDFVQTYRSSRAAESLRSAVAPTATVLRDGKWTEVDRRTVVVGDVVRLSAGDLVPADARLVEARDLHVQQAALTGESMPAAKEAAVGDFDTAPTPTATTDPSDPGTVFLGTSVVSGSATAVVARTGRRTQFGDIAARLAARPPDTEFERGLRRFSHLILQAVVALTLLVLLGGIAMRRDPLQSMLFAIALAVGLVPEFLPMITTVTLANGAVRMSRRHVIVKHLPAIQNLGSVDVLCSDKTGTLTSGEVRYARSVAIDGGPSPSAFALGWLNASLETGVRNPLDAAILREPRPEPVAYEKVDELPFDFERRRLSVVVRTADGPLIVTKGASEAVLAVCVAYEVRDDATAARGVASHAPLDDAARERCARLVHSLGADGLRVVAVASRAVEASAGYTLADERDLVLAGFLAFRDPPLPGVEDVVGALARDGVRVLVLSGDEGVVTQRVCAEVGLEGEGIVLGAEVDRMTDTALAHVAERATGFARLNPAQKTRVIAALRSRSHVVGFLGDGINDAPALRAADVGISVSTATDVAKDSADVILTERGLDVLHAGIVEGRTAFGNTMKYLLMGTSSNFGNMFSMAVASVALPFLPMLPTQILLNNFLYDAAQVTIPTDNVDAEYIARPHRWDVSVLRDFMLVVGPVSSLFDFLTFFVLLKLFHASQETFHTGWFVESLTTQTMVLFAIRTARSPLRSRPSAALMATVLAVVAAGLLLPITPIAAPLGLVPLPAVFYAYLFLVTAAYLGTTELVKRPLMRRMLRSARTRR